ncbi:MAG: SH3 domain-containing protein [Candidatus Hodarchaeota archaeon]
MINKYCRVIKEYKTPFPDPIILKKGERVSIEDRECDWPGWVWAINKSTKSGWVPRSYIKIHKGYAEMAKDYNATELTASIGEEFLIEKEESGWVWVSSKMGKSGWIPLENIEII